MDRAASFEEKAARREGDYEGVRMGSYRSPNGKVIKRRGTGQPVADAEVRAL